MERLKRIRVNAKVRTTGISETLLIKNRGVDAKSDVLLWVRYDSGNTDQYQLGDLPKGKTLKVDLRSLKKRITEFFITFRDECAGIERGTRVASANSTFFKELRCSWYDVGNKKEDFLIGGTEATIK